MVFILQKPSCQLYQWAVKLVSSERVVLLMLNQCPVCDATNLTETETHTANQIIINCDQHHAAANFMVSVCICMGYFFFRLDNNNKNNNIY